MTGSRTQRGVVDELARGVLSVLVLGALSAGVARANEGVSAGFDFLQTLPGTEVDLSGLGLGLVQLESFPFDESIGEADTVVQRLAPVPIVGGTIPIEIVALSLKSVAPVDLTPLGGPFIGVFSDLYTTVDSLGHPNIPVYDPLIPSQGQMEIQHGTPEGGSFDSCFGDLADPGTCNFLGVPGGGVYADLIFTIVGGDPSNLLDVILTTPAQRIALFTSGSTWVHNDQPPVGRGCPRVGFFGSPNCSWKITLILENGPHPVKQVHTKAVHSNPGSVSWPSPRRRLRAPSAPCAVAARRRRPP